MPMPMPAERNSAVVKILMASSKIFAGMADHAKACRTARLQRCSRNSTGVMMRARRHRAANKRAPRDACGHAGPEEQRCDQAVAIRRSQSRQRR